MLFNVVENCLRGREERKTRNPLSKGGISNNATSLEKGKEASCSKEKEREEEGEGGAN